MSSQPAPIIAGYDGSPASRTAMHWAAAEAHRLHARLRIVEAFELVIALRPTPGAVVPLAALRTAREHGLDALAEGLHKQAVTMAAAAQEALAKTSSNGGPRGDIDDHTNANAEWLLAQVRRIESTLVPVVNAAVQQRESDSVLANKMVQIIELLDAHPRLAAINEHVEQKKLGR